MIDVSRETAAKLALLSEAIRRENYRQNLIAASTLVDLQRRHVDDSLQLILLAPPGLWLDIGTGGGFPGLVVAIARDDPIIMVEPRARRAEFLQRMVDLLELTHARVNKAAVESLAPIGAAVISARAVAPLHRLLPLAARHLTPDGICLFPKGRTAAEELAAAEHAWQGEFRLIPSSTEPEASIIMIRGLAPRVRRRETR